jgi:hypothetical protein
MTIFARRARASCFSDAAICFRNEAENVPTASSDSKSCAKSMVTRLYSSQIIQQGERKPPRLHSISGTPRAARVFSGGRDVNGSKNKAAGSAEVRTITHTYGSGFPAGFFANLSLSRPQIVEADDIADLRHIRFPERSIRPDLPSEHHEFHLERFQRYKVAHALR